jgi:uncharacterized protein involved in exopolysaccharide biosynthesis
MAEITKKTSEEKIQNIIEKLSSYFQKLWNNRKKFLILNGVVLIFALVYLFIIAKPYYESSITILPDYGNKSSLLSQFGELASLAGVKVGESSPSEIYQNLITSEAVLYPVIYEKYKTKKYSAPMDLVNYFEFNAESSIPSELKNRRVFQKCLEDLVKDRIKIDVERMTKIITITVEMPESKMAADVANRIAQSLDEYVRTKKKSYVIEQRQYIEKRMAQIHDSLTRAEERLKDFREQNRAMTQSPSLTMLMGRLMREVEIKQTVFGELNKQYEIAKIDEIRDMPIINKREDAMEPIIKTGPLRALNLLKILLLSIVLSSVYIITFDKQKKYTTIIKSTFSKRHKS